MKSCKSMLVIIAVTLLVALSGSAYATTLIVPTGDGGFENGTTFPANGWTAVNGANNQWYIGSAPVVYAGTNCAFTGTSSSSWLGEAYANVNMFYRDIAVPSGEAQLHLTFMYKFQVQDIGYDWLKIFLVPTTTTPVAGTELTSGQMGLRYDGSLTWVQITIDTTITAGQSYRLVFSFKTDGVTPHAAVAVDNIQLTSIIPLPTIIHTPLTSTTSTAPQLVSATISSSFGIAGTPNQPRLYYRTDTLGVYTALTMTNTTGNTWQAAIPGFPVGTLIQYYIAVQDLYVPPNVATLPSGGSGTNPPGTTPPTVPYQYNIIRLVTNYTFFPTLGTFTPLTGATVATLTGGSLDDGWYDNIPIGFTFNYLGIGFTAISAATNGCFVFGPALGVSMITNNLTSGTPRPIIGPIWDDCDMASGTLSYLTEGTAPNRVFTIEWLNLEWYFSAAGPSISVQVKLYEATGRVEFIYRQEANATGTTTASIGITGVGTGAGNFLSLDGTGASPNVSSTLEITTLTGKPATGQIYAFDPRPFPKITHTPLASDTTTSPRLVSAVITSSVGLAGSPNQPRLYYRTTPGVYTPITMTNTSDDMWNATIPGQSSGTVEYYIAAQDISVPPLVMTAPSGGSGANPPGTTPPSSPYFYNILHPMSGIKYIVNGITATDTYPSFTAAINAININSVGAGGITFNVPAGQIFDEMPPALTATGTLANQVIFQKSGVGTNPLVRPSVAGTKTTSTIAYDGDAIFKIAGGDYITFNGINVRDTFTASGAATYEYGYMTVKTATDACKNITIMNCEIKMKKVSLYSAGICISNNDNTGAQVTVSTTGGRTGNIYIYNNTIDSAYNGIVQRGYAHSVPPYDLQDQNIYIGDAGGNSISNYGGSSAIAYAYYGIYYNNVKVNNNTIRGGTGQTTTTYGLMLSTGYNANLDIINNDISIGSSATTSNLVGIYSAGGGSGVDNIVNIKKNVIHDISYTASTSGVFYGIYQYVSGIINVNVDSNTVRNITSGISTSTGTVYGIYNYYGTNQNTRWNQVHSITLAGTGSQYFYGIYSYYGTNKTVTYNTIRDITITGTGYFYGIDGYYGTNLNMSYNKVYNCIRTTGTSGYMYLTYPYYNTTLIFTNNEIYNCGGSNASYAGYIYTVYAYSTATTVNIYNNNIHNIYAGGAGIVYGLYSYPTGPTHNVYNNTIDSLSSGGSSVYGLYVSAGAPAYVYNNNIWYLKSTGISGVVYGLTIGAGTTMNVYNNFVTDLHTPTATGTDAIRGLYISGGTTVNAYYNTVFLNDTSSSATTYGNTAIYASTTPTVTLNNNIGVNLSKSGPTAGCVVAYRRSTSTLTTYASTSNNNCFYAGTPGAKNVIYYQAANDSSVTMADYKTRVTPRDAVSVTELPPFVNVATRPYNLHINGAIATRLESGGQPITGITTDIDGDTRAGSSKLHNNVAPDLGADEFLGIAIDEVGPMITYILLPYTSSLASRTLTATIIDAVSGVAVEAGRRPTLFFNKNRGTWYRDSLFAPSWTFTIDVTKLGGVVAGDSVFYYVQAYDSSGNVSVNPGTAPTTSNYYIITQASLSGNYTVGLALFNRLTGRNITFEKSVRKVMKEIQVPDENTGAQVTSAPDKSARVSDAPDITMRTELIEVEEIAWIPMENGKVYTGDLYVKKSEHPELSFPQGTDGDYATITASVADLNLRGVSGPTNFLLVDNAYPTETYPIIINVANEIKPTVANRVTIKPNTGMSPVISGASASSQIFRIVSSYITIDGSNSGGTTRNLTIQNTSTTTPQVIGISSSGTTPTVGVTVKNCIIINGVSSSSAVVVSAVGGTAGNFNNITIQNNSVQLAYIGIYLIANVATDNGSALITGNDLNTSGTNAISLVGVYVQGADGAMVTNNNIGNYTTTYTSNVTGVWFATGTTNSTIANNTIGPINITTAPPRGIAISTGMTNSNITISGNIITGIITSYSGAEYGIYIFSTTTGVIVNKNKISTLYNSSASGYSAVGIALAITVSAANVTVSNNFIWDVAGYGWGSLTTDNGYGIWVLSGDGYKIYYNSINLATNQTSVSGIPACLIISSAVTTAGALDIRNNIFSIPATVGTDRYAVLSNAANTVFSNIDYNDYLTSGPNLGYIGATNRANLTAWRTGTGQDANSISADPLFTSPSNLHIPLTVNSPINRAATPISGITVDIDNEPRNPSWPDIGADEYTPNAPGEFTLISPLNGAINQPLTGQLVWHKSVLAEFYDVYLDVVNPPVTKVITLPTETTYTYSTMPNLTYYWKVVAQNDTGVIEGSTSSAIWSFETEIWDAGATAIIKPSAIGFAGNVITPKVKVKNFGSVAISFPVTMIIGAVYTNTKTVNNLMAGDSLVVNFDPWTAELGTYNLLAYTGLEWDNNNANDTVRGSVEIQPPAHNVGTIEIIAPLDTIVEGTVVTPRAMIKNFGAYTENFTVRFKIGEVYNQTVTIENFESSAETTISFPNWTATRCNYVVSCSTELAIDQLPEDDQIAEMLTVRYDDVGVVSILAPQDTVITCNDYTPMVVISNNGVHTYPALCSVMVKIMRYPAQMESSYCNIGPAPTADVIYESWMVTELSMEEVDTLYFPEWHPYWWDIYWTLDPTYHMVIAEVKMAADMNSENDMLNEELIAKGRSNDLQMNWAGLLNGYTPMHAETLGVGTYNVASVVSNSPMGPSAKFRAKVKIIRENTNSIVYSKYEDRTLAAQSYTCIAFQTGWSPSDTGWYLVRSWLETKDGVDVVPQNNSWEKHYYFINSGPSEEGIVKTNEPIQHAGSADLPTTFGLMANRPNPFMTHTTIQWQIPVNSNVAISIYDATGRIVKTLVNGSYTPGYYNITWDRSDENHNKVASGIYFFEMRTDKYSARHKMVITN
jgi:hypothetical protein